MSDINFNKSILSKINNGILLYPCSGYDYNLPIELFYKQINDFYFVDRWAYLNLEQDFRKKSEFLTHDCELISTQIEGSVAVERKVIKLKEVENYYNYHRKSSYESIEPGLRTDEYRHKNSGRIFKVHFRRGFGIFALRQYITELDIFFYRGDSMGEGGSNAWWNSRPSITYLLSKLKSGGLYITDGSNCYERNNYKELYYGLNNFIDIFGNRFERKGYVGVRYGQTHIWEVTKVSNFEESKLFKNDILYARRRFFHEDV